MIITLNALEIRKIITDHLRKLGISVSLEDVVLSENEVIATADTSAEHFKPKPVGDFPKPTRPEWAGGSNGEWPYPQPPKVFLQELTRSSDRT